MTGMRVILAIILVTIAAAEARAQRTLYVNGTTGNDATTYAANSAATPWRTIGRAAWGSTNRNSPVASQAAQAGDTVQIAAGTYNFSGSINHRFGVVYNPVNEGTGPGNTITFAAQGIVTLTAPSTASPVIGCYQRDYVIWRGSFDLNEASIQTTPDTGAVVMAGGVTGCGVDGIRVNGDGTPGWVDNHTGVRIEVCNSCYVRNSTITNVHHELENHNGSGVMLYDTVNTLIEHNYIYDVDNAVFVKGVAGTVPQSGTIVRFNLMVDCYECVTLLASRDSRVYQNVIRDSRIGINLLAYSSGSNDHPVGDWFVNNTIDNMSAICIYPGGGNYHQNVRVWNNVMTNCEYANWRDGTISSSSAVVDWEHNVYHAYRVFADHNGGRLTFDTWRSTLGHDQAAPGSVSTDPRYANAAADDFRLCTGAGVPHANCTSASTVRNIGLDILDLDGDGSTADTIPAGAFVTNNEVIGLGAGSILPSAPTNLRITTP